MMRMLSGIKMKIHLLEILQLAMASMHIQILLQGKKTYGLEIINKVLWLIIAIYKETNKWAYKTKKCSYPIEQHRTKIESMMIWHSMA